MEGNETRKTFFSVKGPREGLTEDQSKPVDFYCPVVLLLLVGHRRERNKVPRRGYHWRREKTRSTEVRRYRGPEAIMVDRETREVETPSSGRDGIRNIQRTKDRRKSQKDYRKVCSRGINWKMIIWTTVPKTKGLVCDWLFSRGISQSLVRNS